MMRVSIAALLAVAACDSSPSKNQAAHGSAAPVPVAPAPEPAPEPTMVAPTPDTPPPPANDAPPIRVDRPQVAGSMDAEAVYRVVRHNTNRLRDCYDGAREDDRELSGGLD